MYGDSGNGTAKSLKSLMRKCCGNGGNTMLKSLKSLCGNVCGKVSIIDRGFRMERNTRLMSYAQGIWVSDRSCRLGSLTMGAGR